MIKFTKTAKKHIEEKDAETRARLRDAIEKLPSGDIVRLKGYRNEYRLRVGGLRVLFHNEDGDIIIEDVLTRGEAYRHQRSKR